MSKYFINKYIKLCLTSLLLITASSLVQAKNTPLNRSEPPQRPTFDSLDLNQDGDIDFDEFSSHELPHGDHQTIFDTIDTNNNGVINNDEFTNHKPPQPQKRREN